MQINQIELELIAVGFLIVVTFAGVLYDFRRKINRRIDSLEEKVNKLREKQ